MPDIYYNFRQQSLWCLSLQRERMELRRELAQPVGHFKSNISSRTSQTWDYWAAKRNVKVYLGIPASSGAAGSGYVPSSTLAPIIHNLRVSFPSFGGVMIWYASPAL